MGLAKIYIISDGRAVAASDAAAKEWRQEGGHTLALVPHLNQLGEKERGMRDILIDDSRWGMVDVEHHGRRGPTFTVLDANHWTVEEPVLDEQGRQLNHTIGRLAGLPMTRRAYAKSLDSVLDMVARLYTAGLLRDPAVIAAEREERNRRYREASEREEQRREDARRQLARAIEAVDLTIHGGISPGDDNTGVHDALAILRQLQKSGEWP